MSFKRRAIKFRAFHNITESITESDFIMKVDKESLERFFKLELYDISFYKSVCHFQCYVGNSVYYIVLKADKIFKCIQ